LPASSRSSIESLAILIEVNKGGERGSPENAAQPVGLLVCPNLNPPAVESRMGAGADASAVPVPIPAHQTGHARFEHPAFRLASS